MLSSHAAQSFHRPEFLAASAVHTDTVECVLYNPVGRFLLNGKWSLLHVVLKKRGHSAPNALKPQKSIEIAVPLKRICPTSRVSGHAKIGKVGLISLIGQLLDQKAPSPQTQIPEWACQRVRAFMGESG